MMNAERKIGADLRVIKMDGWSRSMWFDETGQTWINPSPNMRSLTEATLYPGIGLLETTNVSVGRGTDTPFEVVGAPWIDGQQLAEYLNDRQLKGVRFVPIRFKPNASVYKDQDCGGVNIIITNRDTVQFGSNRPRDRRGAAESFTRTIGKSTSIAACSSTANFWKWSNEATCPSRSKKRPPPRPQPLKSGGHHTCFTNS